MYNYLAILFVFYAVGWIDLSVLVVCGVGMLITYGVSP